MTARETALTVVVAQAEPVVADFRRRFDPATGRRVPPHVTLLYPFVDAGSVGDDLLLEIRDLYAPIAPFDFELARVDRFPAHVWLAPEPRERFAELIELTCVRFPDYPRYGGEFGDSEPVPHLTIGEADGLAVEELAAAAERELGGRLPLPCACRSVSLLEEQPDGTWVWRAEFPLEAR